MYSWIPGRGLEAPVTFAGYYRKTYPALSRALIDRAKLLFENLRYLFNRNGHFSFLYDSDYVFIKQKDSEIMNQTREYG